MSNPFDYVNAVSYTKENIMVGTDNDKLAEKGYSPFLTNRALSYHNDTVGHANEMNMRHFADNKLQFDFLLNSVRPKKRYAKWEKKRDDGDLAVVKEYFGYSDTKALQALTVLTKKQLKEIKTTLEKGGKNA
jgi:hypothetical protein